METGFTLTFTSGNAAFEPDPRAETARILRAVAAKIESESDCGAVRDANGNSVGWYALTVEEGESEQ